MLWLPDVEMQAKFVFLQKDLLFTKRTIKHLELLLLMDYKKSNLVILCLEIQEWDLWLELIYIKVLLIKLKIFQTPIR